jgi:hypothetical protein
MNIQNFTITTDLRETFVHWFQQWKAGALQRPYGPAAIRDLYDDYRCAIGSEQKGLSITRFSRELANRMLVAIHRQRGHLIRMAMPVPGMQVPGQPRGQQYGAEQGAMVMLHLTSSTYQHLQAVVENCNLSNKNRRGSTTHGKLDVAGLLAMLAEDAAMTNSRPGSWEGANMEQVLACHGYQ